MVLPFQLRSSAKFLPLVIFENIQFFSRKLIFLFFQKKTIFECFENRTISVALNGKFANSRVFKKMSTLFSEVFFLLKTPILESFEKVYYFTRISRQLCDLLGFCQVSRFRLKNPSSFCKNPYSERFEKFHCISRVLRWIFPTVLPKKPSFWLFWETSLFQSLSTALTDFENFCNFFY